MALVMRELISDVLVDLHRSLSILVDDLSSDRPDLAAALAAHAARLPAARPTQPRRTTCSASVACEQLPPLLYQALDEGVLGAAEFDRLMLRQRRTAAVQGLRLGAAQRRLSDSPSDSESSAGPCISDGPSPVEGVAGVAVSACR